MTKKRTHKKREVVGTKKRMQRSKFNLVNNKNHFSQFKDFEFDLKHLKDMDKYFDLNNLKELDQYFDLNNFKNLDQFFDLNGFKDLLKQIEVYLSISIDFVSLGASNSFKRANKEVFQLDNTNEVEGLSYE